MADQAPAAASVDNRTEIKKSPVEFTRHWIQAIELAGEEEKTWRDNAKETNERYRKTKAKSFNILYSSIQTTVPALYNSEPIPDIRRRFGDDDPVGRNAADMLERILSIQSELYDFDGTMKAAVKDRQLVGRGIARVRVVLGQSGSKHVECEPVIWDDYRRGPAKTRKDLPWEAFRHRMTREELIALAGPDIGKAVNLDTIVEGADAKKADSLPDLFKRAIVWEVWDRIERHVYWFAESFKDGPLKTMPDPYRLREFFCTPKPLYSVESTDTLVPVVEFMIWKPLADEMDQLTARIASIVRVMKLRGIYAGQFESLIAKLKGLDDGELAAATDSAREMQEGGIEKAIWMWPVDMAIKVVQGLYEAREQAKQALYELTGISDILRGQTEASETATAQQIKAQWGSLRLQEAQREVQRFARDLFRMKADLSCQEMTFAEMTAMTGISFMPKTAPPPQVPPNAPPEVQAQAQQQAALVQQQAMMAAQKMAQQVEMLLKGPPNETAEQEQAHDLAREFNIEIETDSTIRADLSQAQQNVSGFVTGLGEFLQGVGPAVQAGMMPPEIAVKYIGTFSRNFKLGREAENLTDEWVKWLEAKAQQPPPPNPEQQKAQMEMQQMQAEAQAKQAERAAELQAQQQKNAMELEAKQAELAIKREELELKREEIGLKAHSMRQEHAFRMQATRESAAIEQDNRAKDAEFEDQRRQSELAFMKQRQAAKPNGAANG